MIGNPNRLKAFEQRLQLVEMDYDVRVPRRLPCYKDRSEVVFKPLHDCTFMEVLEAPSILESLVAQLKNELDGAQTLIALFASTESSSRH